MIPHYFKLACRLLLRNSLFTGINLLGLSVGFAVFFILWQYAASELKSDQFHKDEKRTYLLTFNNEGMSEEDVGQKLFFWTPSGFPIRAGQDYPELSNYCRFITQRFFDRSFIPDHGKEIYFSHTDQKGNKNSFLEEKLLYADTNLFNFFTIPLIKGSASQVLKEPNAVVLSEKIAVKYFGFDDPVGNTIILNDSIPLTVTGVYENFPSNSFMRFEAVLSMIRIEKTTSTIDLSHGTLFPCYFKLPIGTQPIRAEKDIENAFKKHYAQEYKKWNWNINRLTPQFMPLRHVAFEAFKVKSKFILNIFRIAALFILAMAWINYINLTISKNAKRLKELAARVAVGARPKHSITQFIIEAGLLNFIALLLSVTLIQFVKTPLQIFLDFNLLGIQETLFSSSFIGVISVCFSGVLLTGFYPAWITWNQTPRKLFGSIQSSPGNSLGSWMTIFQFVIAVVLLVWIFGVSGQIHYILNKDLGFDKEQVIVVDLPFQRTLTFQSDVEKFIREIAAQSDVADYAISSSVSGDSDSNGIGLQVNSASKFIGVGTNGGIDHRFVPFYNLKILAGRNFLPDNPADKNSILVSHITAQRLGINNPEDAIGKRILIESAAWTHNMIPAEIIGVIEDYARNPLFYNFGMWSNNSGVALTYGNSLDAENIPKKISIKVNLLQFEKILNKIKSSYETSFYGMPFNWYFLEEHFNQYYQREKIARNQIIFFTVIAIGIACLGLLGMITQKVVAKTKEIGIRKVLGADLLQITKILLDTTLKQIIVATIIGIPVAYYLVQQYLQKFSERITLHWWYYLVPVIILLVIMIITVSGVLWKAARTNPVESMRYE